MPISEEFQERGADGTTRTVQYLERARFEYHPEFKGTMYEVELGLLAREIAAAHRAMPPSRRSIASSAPAGARFSPETGHSLADPFADLLGYERRLARSSASRSRSLSRSSNADTGQTYLVQYFERYRLEYHPETNGIAIGPPRRAGRPDAWLPAALTSRAIVPAGICDRLPVEEHRAPLVPQWRNGRRGGLKLRWVIPVWVRPPPAAPPKFPCIASKSGNAPAAIRHSAGAITSRLLHGRFQTPPKSATSMLSAACRCMSGVTCE